MIINTGCRTDIPAFYSKWFINRVREGYVLVRNPYYEDRVTKYVFDSSVVDFIDFCTKNPCPMIKYMDELKDYNLFWYVTITPYGKDIELNVPDKDIVIEGVKKLCSFPNNLFVGWRYDPIFFNDEFDINRHIMEFRDIASRLSGYVDCCVISFLDMYEKVKRNAPDLRVPSKDEMIYLAKEFVFIGKEYGISIYSCSEGDFLSCYGVNVGGCRSKELVEKYLGYGLNVSNVKPIRDCSCLLGNDIGAYNSCLHFCRYCYANYDRESVIRNVKCHDDDSPLLIGNIKNSDIITLARQVSYKKDFDQLSLF